MGAATWQDANYADGPKVSAWISRNIEVDREDGTTLRRLYEWRIGGTAQFVCVDRLLIRYGRLVSELPDEVWLEERPDREPHEKRVVAPPPKVKMCANCGEPIPYRKPCGDARGRKEYTRMRFCSRLCSEVVLTGNPNPLQASANA